MPSSGSRNIFDQYNAPENRLSHAVATCLSEDRLLLKSFLRRFAGHWKPDGKRLQVVEQRLPGEVEVAEEKADARGLPDICVHDGEAAVLAIESKIEARHSETQLARHARTLKSRGFRNTRLLSIVGDPRVTGREIPVVEWQDVYEWARGLSFRSRWAGRLADYLEVTEAKLGEVGYLRNAMLTRFSGIPFGDDTPYDYRQAKRLLRVLISELRGRRELQRHLDADLTGPGRPAITGKATPYVWDFIPLMCSRGAKQFTRFPHLTVAISAQHLLAIVTVPNGIRQPLRRALRDLGQSGFEDLATKIAIRLCCDLRRAPGFMPLIEVRQRHYRSQRSDPIVDADLDFDLRTAIPVSQQPLARDGVKYQPEWLRFTYEALRGKKSNIQIAFGARFRYDRCPAVRTRQALDLVVSTWLACKPLLKAMGLESSTSAS